MLNTHVTPPSGISDDELTSGINDEMLDEDLDKETLEDEETLDWDEEWEKSDWDGSKKSPKWEDFWRKKFYVTTNMQNRKLAELQNELNWIKNSKSLSDDELEKIKEKYDEEDLKIIEKIIERKANDLMDSRGQKSLAQKELNIFLKQFPEVTEPELKHIRDLQKTYWYSLKKAYSIITWKPVENVKKSPSVWNSFWWDNDRSKKWNDNSDEKAMKDMEAFM